MRSGLRACPGKTLGDGVEVVAPIEAVGEAGEIALGMLRTDMVVGAGDRRLDIAERRVDPFEGCPLCRLAARSGSHGEVIDVRLGDRRPAGQTVADRAAPGLDLGLGEALHCYRGHDYEGNARVIIAGQKRGLTPTKRHEQKRRNGIEAVICHAKFDHRMDRNHLLGPVGDAINALAAACGYNLRRILDAIRRLCALVILMLIARMAKFDTWSVPVR